MNFKYAIQDDHALLSEVDYQPKEFICPDGNSIRFYLSDLIHGQILLLHKTDGALEIFPIIKGKGVAVSHGYWLENFYSSHFKLVGDYMHVSLSHFIESESPFILKRIRGSQNLTMSFGHFILDELNFLRCFTSLPDFNSYSFLELYSSLAVLLNFLFLPS